MRHKHKRMYKHIEAHTYNINNYIGIANTYDTKDTNFRIGLLLQSAGPTSSPSQIQANTFTKAYCKQTHSHTQTHTQIQEHTQIHMQM